MKVTYIVIALSICCVFLSTKTAEVLDLWNYVADNGYHYQRQMLPFVPTKYFRETDSWAYLCGVQDGFCLVVQPQERPIRVSTEKSHQVCCFPVLS